MEEILKQILDELRFLNSRERDMETRLKALETKDRLMSPGEAKDYLGISYKTLRSRTEKGYLHTVVRGGERGYLMSELKRIKSNP